MSGKISLMPDRGWFEPARSIAFGSILDTYSIIGDPIDNATRVFIIFNKTDKDVWISIDGTKDYWPISSGMSMISDEASNGKALPAGIAFYVKRFTAGDAPTSGSVIVSIGYKI